MSDGGRFYRLNADEVLGAAVVRAFPFTFATPSLRTGVALYTPTPGEILYDAWFSITTAFDGTTPQADIGLFTSGGQTQGIFGNLASVVDMTAVNTSAVGFALPVATDLLVTGTGAIAQFATADPLCLAVSQDGHAGGTATGATHGAGTLYTVTANPA